MGNEIYYRALGDSLTQGAGVIFRRGFIHYYNDYIVSQFSQPVRTELFARQGLISNELRQLLDDPHIQKRVSSANIITITIGSNDLLHAHDHFLKTFNPLVFERAEQTFYSNLQHILWKIQFLKQVHTSPYFIRLIGLYNPFPHLPYSVFWINRFNAILQSMTSPLVRYVDLMTPFSIAGERVYSFAGIQPNRLGYRLIAKALHETGYNPLSFLHQPQN